MSYKADTDVPEVLGGKLGQYSGVDRVIAKRLFVLLQPEAVEPRRDVHARLPDAVTAALVYLNAKWYETRMLSETRRRRRLSRGESALRTVRTRGRVGADRLYEKWRG